ncbi:hypothetical protein ASD15_15220 [Massilia sp. Root351]|jgi:hypothetical protein|uniref:hypothetical protein n=1 Tax=Massilia sp. Root351 TaxID=1736522 RepID=UPI00070D78CE|nr:hypothetical protein [Massilia sp. Root351]KQV80217.1 hypothetical protein ASD15_15220 [Massilia sp. Root351]
MSSQKMATRHLALHATRLGVARWRLGAAGKAPSAMPQAHWHLAAQQHFLDWLAGGGINSEMACENENSGNDAAVLMPHCGAQCEELKFSRVRISDAVE